MFTHLFFGFSVQTGRCWQVCCCLCDRSSASSLCGLFLLWVMLGWRDSVGFLVCSRFQITAWSDSFWHIHSLTHDYCHMCVCFSSRLDIYSWGNKYAKYFLKEKQLSEPLSRFICVFGCVTLLNNHSLVFFRFIFLTFDKSQYLFAQKWLILIGCSFISINHTAINAKIIQNL